MNVESIAHSLGEAKRNGQDWLTSCPCAGHGRGRGDRTPSLSLSEREGKLLVHCHAGCSQNEVIQALKDRNLWPETARESGGFTSKINSAMAKAGLKPNASITAIQTAEKPEEAASRFAADAIANGYELQAIHTYRHEDGQEWFWRIRCKNADGEKWIRPMHRVDDGYKLGEPKFQGQKPLYNLHLLREEPSAEVYIVEGEACADALTNLGVLAVTSGSADSVKGTDWSPLYNRKLVLWADNDEAGQKWESALVNELTGKCDVSLIKTQALDLQEKQDCVDWLARHAGATATLLAALPKREPPREKLKIEVIRVADIIGCPLPPPDQVLKDVFDTGDKVAIIAPSKMRKTFLQMQLALCLASGRDFLTFKVEKPRRVLLYQLELKDHHYLKRMQKLAAAMGISPSEYEERLYLINGRGRDYDPEELQTIVIDQAIEVVCIDPLYKICTGDENSAKDMKEVFKAFDKIAEASNAAVVYLHHDAKGNAGQRDIRDRGAGSNVISRDFDACFTLTSHTTCKDAVVLETLLRNYAPVEPLVIEFEANHFNLSSLAPVKQTSSRSSDPRSFGSLVDEARELLRQEGPMSKVEYERAIKEKVGTTQSNTKAIINYLVSNGSVEMTSHSPKRGLPKMIRIVEFPNPKLQDATEQVNF